MKIAMVCLHADPVGALVTGDGPEARVASLAAALGAAGHEVALYARPGEPEHEKDASPPAGVEVVRLHAAGVQTHDDDSLLQVMPEIGTCLADRWADDPPDVVHAHGWLSGLPTLAATRGTSVPVVLSLPALAATSPPERDAGQSRVRLERALAHSASHLVASSDRQREDLLRLGVERRAVSVVPWGVDPDVYAPEGPVAPRGERPRLLHVGSLAPHRGVDDVLAALRTVPDAELVLAGGPDSTTLDDDEDVARVRALAARLGVEDRVDLRGRLPRPDVPALMRSADLLVTAPHDGPFGTAALEAMACGLPVVAAATGGLVETVVDGATGRLVPPRDPEALAYALRELLRDPVRREGYSVAAIDRARARYAWPRIAGDVVDAYARAGAGPTVDVDADVEAVDEDVEAAEPSGAADDSPSGPQPVVGAAGS
jgi:glycosyltransferase involved in cell wall biosynthesis